RAAQPVPSFGAIPPRRGRRQHQSCPWRLTRRPRPTYARVVALADGQVALASARRAGSVATHPGLLGRAQSLVVGGDTLTPLKIGEPRYVDQPVPSGPAAQGLAQPVTDHHDR